MNTPSCRHVLRTGTQGTLAVTTPALLKLPALYKIGHTPHLYHPYTKATHILGWGHKPSGKKAIALANHHEKVCVLAEEGFLAYGHEANAPLQILFDTHGIHYDPQQPSIIDHYLNAADAPNIRSQATTLMALIRTHNLSKFNTQPTPTAIPTRPFILLCDQVPNDAALVASGATQKRFDAMLSSIKQTWPTHDVIIRTHPKATQGHYKIMEGVRLVTGTDAPGPWLKAADHVVTVSSQLGFEALIHGTNVTCWGTPFYAARGLTRDIGAQPGYQRQQADLEQLVGAALILAPTTFDAVTGAPSTTLALAHHLVSVRKQHTVLTGPITPKGFSQRKKRHLQRFFPKTHQAQKGTTVGWGKVNAPIRVEDGFLRSKGLGADLVAPLSWIVDTTGGVHFDHTAPSMCETLLNTHPIDQTLEDRGKAIKSRLLQQGLTKYNIEPNPKIPCPYESYTLVLGQVEADASLLKSPIKTNQALIETVQAQTSDTLVFRPHPDVSSGLRKGSIPTGAIIDTTTPLLTLIEAATSIHVISSQGGLEALIRDKPVYCHGPAFYAGWGLTQDSMTFERRTRTLSLNALVAILYDVLPLYNNPTTGMPLSLEQAADIIEQRIYKTPSRWKRWLAGQIAQHKDTGSS